jgi:hypothetical protein
MAKKLSITILLTLCLWSVSCSVVLAATGDKALVQCGRTTDASGKTLSAKEQVDSCNFAALIDLINRIINYLIVVATALSAIAFAYVGWLYLTAGDNTGQVTKARTIFMDVAIGFVIILSGWLLFRLIADQFLSDTYKNAVFLNKSN